MDLTIPLENITLNIRVGVLIRNRGGYILEESKNGYCFPVGGRVKAGETSEEAAKREVFEELGITVESLKLRGIVESFFGRDADRVQEICFVYTASDAEDLELGNEFDVYTLDQIESLDLRPHVIKEIIKSSSETVLHLVAKD